MGAEEPRARGQAAGIAVAKGPEPQPGDNTRNPSLAAHGVALGAAPLWPLARPAGIDLLEPT